MAKQRNASPEIKCQCCGIGNLTKTTERELFNYKTDGGNIIELSVDVPVWTCAGCEDTFTDEVAESLRHDAVCNYIGRMRPAELKHLREKYGCSQAAWAELTGFGIASIKRWESGYQIQGLATDRFLRLLSLPLTFAALIKLIQSPRVVESKLPTFQTELSEVTRTEAQVFLLRKCSG